jgi:hypothetical protein
MAQEIRETRLAVEVLHEVRARFESSAALDAAVGTLEMAGFDRADLALPDAPAAPNEELGAAPVANEADARQGRTLATSMAAATGAMIAGGVVVATGGAALAAAAVAVAVGGGAGAFAGAIATAAKDSEQTDRNDKVATGELVLSIRAQTPEKRDLAERLAREAGGREIVVT